MEGFSVGARIRAARHLAGLRRVEDLSGKIGQRGLRTTKLRQMERDEIPQEARDLEAIAHACGVPVEWFVADFSRLAEIAPTDPRRELARLTAQAVRRAAARRAGNLGEGDDPLEAAQ
jgi:transcriptional regulator with XRE-family HTH domain